MNIMGPLASISKAFCPVYGSAFKTIVSPFSNYLGVLLRLISIVFLISWSIFARWEHTCEKLKSYREVNSVKYSSTYAGVGSVYTNWVGTILWVGNAKSRPISNWLGENLVARLTDVRIPNSTDGSKTSQELRYSMVLNNLRIPFFIVSCIRSTWPWVCGWYGLPTTCYIPYCIKKSWNSPMNSPPLSILTIAGVP